MGHSIRSSQIADDAFMIVLLLISLLVGDGCFFWLIDLDQSVPVDFEVFEGRNCFNDLKVAASVSFPTLKVGQVDVCQ